jgi:hypothetical protein
MSTLQWIFIGFLCTLCFLLFRPGAKRREALLEAAASLEGAGEYEEACFRYAAAAGGAYREACREKVRDLWKAHGPFGFSAQLQKLRMEYCSVCTSCGEGYHHLIVSDIHKWVRE